MRFIKFGEKSVGGGSGSIDFGEVDMFGIREEFGINGAAADNENFLRRVLVFGDEYVEVVNDEVWAGEVVVGNDDVFTFL